MSTGRRLLILLAALLVIGAPAVVLRAVCAGATCKKESSGKPVAPPFCPLPQDLKTLIEAGFYADEHRSPDVFGVTKSPEIWGTTGPPNAGAAPQWPSLVGGPSTNVPIVFSGPNVKPSAHIPDGTGVDDIAPTLSQMIGLKRPHPELRAGTAIPGVATPGQKPALILEIAWKGVGSGDLSSAKKSWPYLRSLSKGGAGTLKAQTGSLPIDSTAILTTIGTGALPDQHGIIGTLIRNKQGSLVQAWSPTAPISVLAGFGDDVEQHFSDQPLLGLVGTGTIDRGIIGGNWYLGPDHAHVAIAHGAAVTGAVGKMLAQGFGSDGVPDVLAVVLQGKIPQMDAETQRVVAAAEAAAHGSVDVVVTATGSSATPPPSGAMQASSVVKAMEQRAKAPGVVDAAVPGALFLDQQTLAAKGIALGQIVGVMSAMKSQDGSALMAQSFPAFSISFARYCPGGSS